MPSRGKLYVVGIGPGGLDHMTVKARYAIGESEYVFGNGTYLDQIAHLLDGKKVKRSGMGREVERARQAVELGKENIVSIVSGGDANVYGMAGIVLEMVESLGAPVDVEVVPGVTALTAAAGLLGAPIVGDFAVVSLSDLLTPWEMIEQRLRAASSAGFVIVLYNPRSRNRPSNLRRAIEILRENLDPDTAVGVVCNATREGETKWVTTLERVLEGEEEIDMRTTLIIGNSESRIFLDYIITPRGYHRKYDY